jgi:hypothetical protein
MRMALMQTALTDTAVFPREMRLLLAAMRLSEERAEASSAPLQSYLCQSQLQWEALVRVASWHGVSGLLARRLCAPELQVLIPAAVRVQLAGKVREGSLIAMTQVAALGEIERVMDADGIPALAWKGPALSMDLYGSYALRPATDLDFLVEPTRMEEAVRSLTGLGFARVSEWTRRAAEERAAQLNHEVRMVRARDRVAVELHDAVMPRMFGNGIAVDACLGRSRWLQVDARVRVCVPAREDLLISLCAHGAKHGWERLKWVCDIAALVEHDRDELAWGEVLFRARAAGSLGAVLGGVRLAEELLGARQPEELRDYVRSEAAVRRVVLRTAGALARGSMELKTPSVALHDALNTVVTARARAGYLVRRAMTVTAVDVQSFPVPAKLAVLRYPLRAVRVAGRVLGRGDALKAGKPLSAGGQASVAEGKRRPVRVKALLTPRKVAIGAECAAALVLARVGLKVAKLQPLSRAGCRVFGWLPTDKVALPESLARETAAWVDRVSEFLPGMLCLQQALALQWMLARRGVGYTLHVGISSLEGEFRSHAWVTCNDRVLIGGGQAAEKYREILRCEVLSGGKSRSGAGEKGEC